MRVPDRGTEDHLTREEEEFIKRYLSRPESFPPEFWAAVMQKVVLDLDKIPGSQIVGGRANVPSNYAFVATGETTTSSTYGNLSTVGPTLERMADGDYLLMWGALAVVATAGSGITAKMGVQINSTVASDADSCVSGVAIGASVSVARLKTLENNNNNTVTAKYASNDNTTAVGFTYRWLMALKVGS